MTKSFFVEKGWVKKHSTGLTYVRQQNNNQASGELARHPQVMDTIQSHVEEVNASIAEDEMLSGCQVHRFVVLHKELDADDGELTRTRKVRRKVIGEKFDDIITALYDGSPSVSTVTEVTYEDGRKGSISATLEVRDAKVFADTRKMAAQ